MNREVFDELRQRLMEELDTSRELEDSEILESIDQMILLKPLQSWFRRVAMGR